MLKNVIYPFFFLFLVEKKCIEGRKTPSQDSDIESFKSEADKSDGELRENSLYPFT